ncbi:Transcription factor IBH1 [Bienertia sinuspersici]
MSLNLKSLRTRFALRFIRALKKIHHQEKSFNKRYYKVKVAADASMAAAVGPRRAWSRALLSRARLGWRCRAQSRRESVECWRRKRMHGHGHARAAEGQGQGQAQAQELRSLVPGGEAMDLQNLLDETAHYIKCLTTQVNVMRGIVNCCSTS